MGCFLLLLLIPACYAFCSFVVMLVAGIIAIQYGAHGISFATSCLVTLAISLIAAGAEGDSGRDRNEH